jgi:hypothetical protein
MVVSFIGGGNQSAMGKPLTCRNSDKFDHIMLHRVHLTMSGGICTKVEDTTLTKICSIPHHCIHLGYTGYTNINPNNRVIIKAN